MALTLEQLRADIADVLGEDPADIPLDENLVDYGLDSGGLDDAGGPLARDPRRGHGAGRAASREAGPGGVGQAPGPRVTTSSGGRRGAQTLRQTERAWPEEPPPQPRPAGAAGGPRLISAKVISAGRVGAIMGVRPRGPAAPVLEPRHHHVQHRRRQAQQMVPRSAGPGEPDDHQLPPGREPSAHVDQRLERTAGGAAWRRR